ncbi:MAG: DUF1588 domain-containing protein [Myxococcota bacterium]
MTRPNIQATVIGASLSLLLSSGCYDGRDVDPEGAPQDVADDGDQDEDPTGDDGVNVGDYDVPLRLLTRSEYRGSLRVLFGDEVDLGLDLDLVPDTVVSGFHSVGAAEVTVGEMAAEKYEAAAWAVANRVFAADSDWSAQMGCQPAATLDDACTTDYIQKLGRLAFRRPLTSEELELWAAIARDATALTDEPAQGMATVVSGILQSPFFLYRVETIDPDNASESGRGRFDGASMATRLAFLLTGATPDEAMLDRAAQGEFDTRQGIQDAARALLDSDEASAHLGEFFVELASVDSVGNIDKDQESFPEFDEALAASMLEETRLWLRERVVAPGTDVRSLFDSNETFVDTRLAELYGLAAPPEPGAGFVPVALPPESGRAGLLGHASFLSRHSSPHSSAPTRRGFFLLSAFLCQVPPPPPPDVDTDVDSGEEDEGPMTTRQRFEQHVTDPSCAGCHNLMDPMGYTLEHFDPIGRYRTDEHGLPVDATAEVFGNTVNGAAELGAWLRDTPMTDACMVRNLYRYSNALKDDLPDIEVIEQVAEQLPGLDYQWRELLVDFVASEAFRSIAPVP